MWGSMDNSGKIPLKSALWRKEWLTAEKHAAVGQYFFVCVTYQTHLLCLIFNPPLVWVFWLDNGAPTKTIQGENSSSGRSAPDVSLHGYFAQAHWIVTGEWGGGETY
jgi:hypothetical protein